MRHGSGDRVVICVCLVTLHGMSMRGTVGLGTSYFLGVPVIESNKELLAGGGSRVYMKPLLGMLAPLLIPMVICGLVGMTARRTPLGKRAVE